jgi:hypothetical protein
LSVGRAKDHARILTLFEVDAVKKTDVEALATRHGLGDKWESFARRFLEQ